MLLPVAMVVVAPVAVSATEREADTRTVAVVRAIIVGRGIAVIPAIVRAAAVIVAAVPVAPTPVVCGLYRIRFDAVHLHCGHG